MTVDPHKCFMQDTFIECDVVEEYIRSTTCDETVEVNLLVLGISIDTAT